MVLFKKSETFPHLTRAEGFLIGLIFAIILSAFIPTKTVTKYIKVPEVKIVEKVVEKPVVVKKPVYVSAHDKRQIQCLAENAYFEAGNQSTKGKVAVTNVVMNRVKDERFPKSACAVVHQKSRGVCQFSWVCEGNKRIRNMAVFAESKRVAENVYLGNTHDVTKGAKFYHANYVNPNWGMRRVTQIGAHIFYRG
jgi:spore germination cell wall hydrolase CwlJ-like protein